MMTVERPALLWPDGFDNCSGRLVTRKREPARSFRGSYIDICMKNMRK